MMGARIAALRRQMGLSQQELAARVGVSASAIGMYEQGRREPDCRGLVQLASALDVTTDYLLTGEATPRDGAAVYGAVCAAMRELGGGLTLRSADGAERPFDARELALLLAALLG